MARPARWLDRLGRIVDLVERLLEQEVGSPPSLEDVRRNFVFRWSVGRGGGRLEAVEQPSDFDLDLLVGVDRAVASLVRNTEQFVRGLPSNHVLLYGERGTGKSSAVRGLAPRFGPRGLRLVEVHRSDLIALPRILAATRPLPYRFLLFCDDLSFDEGETGYRELKAALEGSVESPPENVRIVATSNRRHLLPERIVDNEAARLDARGELHVGEAIEERLALSDRFGLRLAFFGFDQKTYLAIVERYAAKAGLALDRETLHAEALRWALARASRSGRIARQFVDDVAGREGLRGEGGEAG